VTGAGQTATNLGDVRATLYYTILRLGLFIVVFGLLYVAGARSVLLLGLSILISGVISYFALNGQRAAMSGAISRRVTDFRERLDAGTRAEDDD
jgi:membrane associated rhomboid family serine protease